MLSWLRRLETRLTPEHKRTLRALTFEESSPGPVLRDFDMLLSFVRGRDLGVSKTYRLLPRRVLPEINAQTVHPIEIGLRQPQLKSFPHIQGLYLMLRATGLGAIGGTSSEPVLIVDEALCEAWSSLRPAEQYFALLEAWLFRGWPEIVGERESYGFIGRQFGDCVDLMHQIPPQGWPISGNNDADRYLSYSPGRMGIALMELFGLLSVEHGLPVEGKGWQIARVHRTPLGEAVFALLYEGVFSDLGKVAELERRLPTSFGLLQPTFLPYVPAWQQNLEAPQWVFREGVHLFRATLWRGLWRLIAVPGDLPLDALAHAVIEAYDFRPDHLYQFSYRNRFGVEERICHPFLEERPSTNQVRVGDVPLPVGQTMVYLFDFGERWEFDVTLERVDPPRPTLHGPVLLDGRGDAPEQYPSWDEEGQLWAR
jgi:hypothetical protein